MTRLQEVSQMESRLRGVWNSIILLPIPLLISELHNTFINTATTETRIRVACFAALTGIYVARWASGNREYIRHTYSSTGPWLMRPIHNSRVFRRILERRFLFDLALFVLHAGMFCCMAVSVANFTYFLSALIGLHLTDLWLLVYEPNAWPKWLIASYQIVLKAGVSDLKRKKKLFVRLVWVDHYPPRTWTWVNFFTALSLGGLIPLSYFVGVNHAIAQMIAVCVLSSLNGYLDFRQTHFGMADMW
jgi:hypothetical protein